MSKILERIARKARPVVTNENNTGLPLPEVIFPIQRTEDYLAAAKKPDVIPNLGFPIIDRKAFESLHWNLRIRRWVPSVAFFNVAEEPVVEANFSISTYVEGWESSGWTRNKMQIASLSMNHVFSLWERLKVDHPRKLRAFIAMLTGSAIGATAVWTIFNTSWGMITPIPGIIGVASFSAALLYCLFLGDHKIANEIRVKYTAKLNHVIPEDVLNLIQSVQHKFNGGVFIVADVGDQWVRQMNGHTYIVPIPKPDPLVVGRHLCVNASNQQTGKEIFYLIHKFDLTPKEAYISSADFVS